jgi:hypothetical protein
VDARFRKGHARRRILYGHTQTVGQQIRRPHLLHRLLIDIPPAEVGKLLGFDEDLRRSRMGRRATLCLHGQHCDEIRDDDGPTSDEHGESPHEDGHPVNEADGESVQGDARKDSLHVVSESDGGFILFPATRLCTIF